MQYRKMINLHNHSPLLHLAFLLSLHSYFVTATRPVRQEMIVVDGMPLNLSPLLLILMAIPLISLSLIACAKLKKKKEQKQAPAAPPPKVKPQGTPIPRSTKPRTEPPASPQPTPAPPPPPPPKEETTAPETTPAPSMTSVVPTTATPTQETVAPDDEIDEQIPPSRNASSTAASPVVYDWDMCMDYTPDVIIQHEFLFQLLERS